MATIPQLLATVLCVVALPSINCAAPLTLQQELTASDGGYLGYFGSSVSVSGDTAVIGAYGTKIGSNTTQGAAYVYVLSGNSWTLQQELTASDGATNDFFGYSVSVSGDTVIIGAFSKTIGSNTQQGAAYVFVRSLGVWTQQQKLTAANGTKGDIFGASVSLSGNMAVIGANGKYKGMGAAYVFANSGGVWTQRHELKAPDGVSRDGFGYSVAVNGNTVVIGAPDKPMDSNTEQGAAYVFANNGGVWTMQAELTAPDGAPLGDFGSSVSIGGDTAAIGSPGKRINYFDQGAVYVFVRSDKVWTQQQELAAPDAATYDSFGHAVAVIGETLVVGASGKNIGTNSSQGAVYVFARSREMWIQQKELTASDGAEGDDFGHAVSVSGESVMIGAYNKTIGSTAEQGAAYVFVH